MSAPSETVPAPRPAEADDDPARDDEIERHWDAVQARVTSARPSPAAGPAAAGDPDDTLETLFVRQERRRHAIDARLSFPLFGRRVYLVVLGGAERRHATRRSRERQRHPLLTLGNVLFLAGVVAAVYALALVAMLAFSGMAAAG
jgi:hypothetical protein